MIRNVRRMAALFVLIMSMTGLYALVTPNAFATSGGTAHISGGYGSTNSRQAALVAAVRREAVLHPNASDRHICYAAHVENIGWQQPVCDGVTTGTTGQGLRMEALDIVVSGVGGVCAAAHVENIGWQPVTCAGDNINVMVGTTGRGLRMEALDISVSSGTVCANAHVENIGWQGSRCASTPSFALAGTTGQGLGMEAVQLTV
ncbi:hypothetical protein [Actinophytocola sp.]|uniref:hypothetical protein n=1 Tax=Actinophytocola sp. TaxID=1872138 RepID=UPI003899BCC8